MTFWQFGASGLGGLLCGIGESQKRGLRRQVEGGDTSPVEDASYRETAAENSFTILIPAVHH